MADQIAFTPERVLTAAAMPGAGYRVQFFASGTTTPVTVYTTADLSVAHPSPLLADATGVFPAVFSAGGAIKAVITKPDGSSFYTVDPALRVSTSASGASDISFSPTAELPFENVQEAIVGAATSAASGFIPFGLGVTGTNARIANLDATGTASGAYRFDNTTVGTFPSGVAATDTGTVQIWRESAGDAVMWLQSGAADRQFTRRLASSTWGAWREVITVNQGATDGDTIIRASGAWARLPVGTDGQVLSVVSGAPDYVNGGARLLETVTAAALASVTFTTPLAGLLYDDAFILCNNAIGSVDDMSMSLRISTDGGATWRNSAGAYRAYLETTGYGAAGSIDQTDTAARLTGPLATDNIGNAAGEVGAFGQINLFGLTRNTKVAGSSRLVYQRAANGLMVRSLSDFQLDAAAVVNGIQLIASSGTISGVFRLYGYAK